MSRFDVFIDIVLRHEGGYNNDPDDRGGETNYGITKRRYPDLDIKNLTRDHAKNIYRQDFYDRMKIDLIKDDLLALHVLDMGVNAGVHTAVKLLQAFFPELKRDGVLGPVTAGVVNKINEQIDMKAVYVACRIERYCEVSKRGRNIKFLTGWINRVYNTDKYYEEAIG